MRVEDEVRQFLQSYRLTEKQVVCGDSLNYYRERQNGLLRGNIQIDDAVHKTLEFGDWGEYWVDVDRDSVLLTKRPSAISYDPEQGDSLFVRADTMWLITPFADDDIIQIGGADSLSHSDMEMQHGSTIDVPREQGRVDNTEQPNTVVDSLGRHSGGEVDLGAVIDSVAVDSTATKPSKRELSAKEQKRLEREQVADTKFRERAEKLRQRDSVMMLRDSIRRVKYELKEKELQQKQEQKLRERLAKRGIVDTTSMCDHDHDHCEHGEKKDTLESSIVDSTIVDSVVIDSATKRVIKAYRRVKAWRSDFQAVCDSLVSFSSDSTMHMYIDPVLWSEDNQITADVIDVFSKNQEITHADFVGNPIMAQMLDTAHYNQVTGKEMTAYFRDNNIYRNDVNSNVQAYYYLQDDETGDLQGFMTLVCGNMTFLIDSQKIDKIIPRIEPDMIIYPMDKIPESEPHRFQKFKWRGDERPARDDVFDRLIRPSQRVQYEGQTKPQFPSTEHINRRREELMRTTRWRDRVDVVAPYAREFIRTLGN